MVSKCRAKHALKWARDKLHLQDWTIRLSWGQDIPIPDDSVAVSICDLQAPRARIFVNLTQCEASKQLCQGSDAVSDERGYHPLAVLFHEFGHILAKKMEIETPGVDVPRRYEQAHNALAEILLDLYCLETDYAESTTPQTKKTV